MRTQAFGAMTAALVLAAGAIGASAATLNVPSQYATIQAAIDAAGNGDTIQLAAGTFGATGTVEPAGLLIKDKSNLTIKGQGRYKTIFRPNQVRTVTLNGALQYPAIYITNGVNVRVEALQLDCILVRGFANRIGFAAHDSTGTVVHDCLLQNMSEVDPYVHLAEFVLKNGATVLSVGGTASAAGAHASYPVANAFDGNAATKYARGTTATYVRYLFGGSASNIVTSYSLTSASDSEQNSTQADPRDWTLQGSQNGTTWTTVDTRSGVLFTARGQTLTFTPTSQTKQYRYYQINITATRVVGVYTDRISYNMNESGSWTPANRGTLEISQCEFYNTGRIGFYAKGFLDVNVHDTTFRKSKTIPSFGYALELESIAQGTIENCTFSDYRNAAISDGSPSAAILVASGGSYAGMDAWATAHGFPTVTVNIINCTMKDNFYAAYCGGENYNTLKCKRMAVVNFIGCEMSGSISHGIMVRDNAATAAGFEQSTMAVNFNDCRIYGNTRYGIRQYVDGGNIRRAKQPVTVENCEFFDNAWGDVNSCGVGAMSGSDLGLTVSNSKWTELEEVNVDARNLGNAFNFSGNYWNSANPDIVAKVAYDNLLPTLTSLYTDAALTATRGVRTVGSLPGAAYATFADAVTAATGSDLIAVFDTGAEIATPVTIASDRTVWTEAGLAIVAGGSLTINEGVTLTLDGVAMKGPTGGMTIEEDTAAVVLNSAPVFGADGTSVTLNGEVAWCAGDVEVFACYGDDGDQGETMVQGASDWDTVVSLGVQGIGAVEDAIAGLTVNTAYTVRLVAVLQSDTGRVAYSPARTFELVQETGEDDIAATGVAQENVTISVQVGAGQTVTVTAYQDSLDGWSTQKVVSATGDIQFEDMLTVDGTWIVVIERDVDGEINTQQFGVERRTYQPNSWYLISMIWDFSTGNTMGGALGTALSDGLVGSTIGDRDTLYAPKAGGDWEQFSWDGSLWDEGNTALPLDPLASYWLNTCGEPGERVAVYVAAAGTGVRSISVPSGWSTLAWALPNARTEAQGWGFPRSHGANSWTASDLMLIMETGEFLQMKPTGRWHRIGQSAPAADVTLNPGSAFIYFNMNGAFNWTPSAE